MNSEDFIKTASIELERWAVSRRVAIPLNNFTAVLRRDFFTDDVIVDLRGYVWAQRIQNETAILTVEYPATWWQHFKQRWFPRWARRRWPVRMQTKTREYEFTCHALHPGFKYEAPKQLGPVVIKTAVTPRW